MAYANLSNVSTRLGRAISDPDEVKQVNAWLGDANRAILRRIPNLDARVDAEEINADDVSQVEAQAVIRKIKNPDGHTYESVDDSRWGLAEGHALDEITILDSEWAMLMPGAAGTPSAAFTISPFAGRTY